MIYRLLLFFTDENRQTEMWLISDSCVILSGEFRDKLLFGRTILKRYDIVVKDDSVTRFGSSGTGVLSVRDNFSVASVRDNFGVATLHNCPPLWRLDLSGCTSLSVIDKKFFCHNFDLRSVVLPRSLRVIK